MTAPDPITGHTFRSPALLRRALTHSSSFYEQSTRAAAPSPRPSSSPPEDNEQMEFLGDAVLGLVVAETLFTTFPRSPEGELTRLRSSLVGREHLSSVATRLRLGDHLRLGRGEDRSGGRKKPALLADALEAVIAAIFLDAGLPAAADFILREIVSPSLGSLRLALDEGSSIGDHKTALQEIVQGASLTQPRYRLLEASGPDHARLFRVAVDIEDSTGAVQTLGEGEGPSKKRAQQEAARLAIERLKLEPLQPGQPAASDARRSSSSRPGARPA